MIMSSLKLSPPSSPDSMSQIENGTRSEAAPRKWPVGDVAQANIQVDQHAFMKVFEGKTFHNKHSNRHTSSDCMS